MTHQLLEGYESTILRGNAGTIKKEGVIYGPVDPTQKLASIAVADVGDAAATLLQNPSKFAGKTYTFNTTPYSNEEVAQAFEEVLQKPVKYVQVSFDDAKKALMGMGMPEWQTDGVLELMRKQHEGKEVMSKKADDFEQVTGRAPLTIKEWVKMVKPGFESSSPAE